MGLIATIQQFTSDLYLHCNPLISTEAGATDITRFRTEVNFTHHTPSRPQHTM